MRAPVTPLATPQHHTAAAARVQIDLSLKMLGGVDIMSAPALQEWFTALICGHITRAMTFPASINLCFTDGPVAEQAAEHSWPRGLATLELQTVYMPGGQVQACMPSMVLKPAAWVDPAFSCDVHAMTYPLVMDPRRPESMEPWTASFPVFDAAQVRPPLASPAVHFKVYTHSVYAEPSTPRGG